MNFDNPLTNYSRYGTNFDLSNSIIQNTSEVTETVAASGLQINSISYGGGIFVLGGENTSSTPLLIEYNVTTGNMNDLSSVVPSPFRFITTVSYHSGLFYFGGIPNGDAWAFAVLNVTTGSIASLSSAFPNLPSGPNIYAFSILGNVLYIGGYYQTNGQGSFLYSYNIANGMVENLTTVLPSQSAMVLTLSSSSSDVFIAGIYGNYSSFAELYNASSGSILNVNLPSKVESLGTSLFYDGNFFTGGSSSYGGELLEINDNGATENYSSYFGDYIQIISLSIFDGSLFIGGWGPNSSFATILNFTAPVTVKSVALTNGWAVNGSELLASASYGNDLVVGGSITTQFYNYSGALLGMISSNLAFTDLSNKVPKTYQSQTYFPPPQQDFYVYAYPNVVSKDGNITFYGQDLEKNTSYELTYGNYAISLETNSIGSFSYKTKLDNLSPGDYLVSLTNGGKSYYNYFAVLYNYSSMIYGAKIPKTLDIGYSNLRDGAVVRDGQYIEFYRQTDGIIPVTSINYLVQWNQILFQNLTSKGWTVAPVNQLGYASQFSINPLTFQYSFWNDYGISEVSTSGQFTNLPNLNSYIYVSGNEMIVWIPYSIVNETEFPWVFATDYVQNSPIYNFNYRIEAGQSYVSYFYANETPTISFQNTNTVEFTQTGLPKNYEWEVSILNTRGNSTVYQGNYTATGNILDVPLPRGSYEYEIFSMSNLYLTHNSVNTLNLTESNSSLYVNVTFYEDPTYIQYQYYVNIPAHSNHVFYLPSFTGNASLSMGVMNGTLNVSIHNQGLLIYSQNIIGRATNYDAFEPSAGGYGYANFYSSGNESIVVYNPGNGVVLFAYNFWNGFINNYTASLITIPPQFADNLNPISQNSYSAYEPNILNKALSLSVVAPYIRYPTPIAVWVGEGYIYPNNSFWWVQLGYTNWNDNDILYPFYESFSNIPGVPSIGVTDNSFPLIANHTYNFTMKLTKNTTWGFYVNGNLIQGSGYPGTMNTTTEYAFYNKDFGFETLTEQRAELSKNACIPDNNVKILSVESFLVNGTWIRAENFSMNNIGENWWNGNTSSSMGMDLWSIQGNLQNKSIPPREIIFENKGEPLFNIPSYYNDSGYPVFGNFSYPYANVSYNGVYAEISEQTNGSIYVIPKYKDVLVSLLQFKGNTNMLQNFTNSKITVPTYLKNPYYHSKEAMTVALENNTLWAYGGKFQEIILTRFQNYNVTFTMSGLPVGTEWYVNITGQQFSGPLPSSQTAYSTSLPNGSYYYVVSSGNKFYKPSYQGSFTVSGVGISEPITFSEVTYTVTFSETGLRSGSSWSVTLNGTAESSTGNISFIVPNGTYSYSIASIPGYSILSMPGYNGSSGVLTVSGYNLSHPVTFVKVITNGYLTGSISPSNASIWINGTLYHAVNGHFNISLNPGTYEVRVSAPGYSTYTTNITISSSSVSKLPIQNLTEITKPMSFPLSLIVVILVLIVAIIAVAIVVIIRKRGREP
ncbi:MAG: PEGA domain-containing protein [Thermoplasmata archaeon]